MAMRLPNQDGKVVWEEVTELDQKVAKLNRDGEPVRSEKVLQFKPKAGSVFPAKRRLVKRMMLDSFIQSVAPSCCTGRVGDES